MDNMVQLQSKLFADEVEIIKPTKKMKILDGVSEVVFYLLIFVLATVAFFVLRPLNAEIHKSAVPQMIMTVCLGGLVTLGAVLALQGKLDRKTTVFLIFCVGVVLKLFYMVYTPATTRQHDTFNKARTGHEAYAYILFSTGKLPTTNDYQFYHPPLNAILQATFMKFMAWLTGELTEILNLGNYFPNAFQQGFNSSKLAGVENAEYRYFLYSTNQILAFTYGVITSVYMLKILKLFDFSGKTSIILSALITLFPRTIQFSGQLNNDPISFLCSVLAVYFVLKWQREGKKIGYIIGSALSCGFGMMAKLATATICLPIAGVFVYEFILTIFKKDGSMKFWKMFVQYALFVVVCAPIALWFQIYARNEFGQTFGHVFGNLNKALLTTHHSWFERFVIASPSEYFSRIFCETFSEIVDGVIVEYNNYNLFNFSLRSALFAEVHYTYGEGFAILSIIFAYAFCALLAVGLVWCLVQFIKTKKSGIKNESDGKIIELKDFIFLFLLVQSQVIPEIIFYVKMPYACTMDFRYIMPMIVGIALMTGYVMKALKVNGSSFAINLRRITALAIVLMLVSTTVFYCVAV